MSGEIKITVADEQARNFARGIIRIRSVLRRLEHTPRLTSAARLALRDCENVARGALAGRTIGPATTDDDTFDVQLGGLADKDLAAVLEYALGQTLESEGEIDPLNRPDLSLLERETLLRKAIAHASD